MLGLHPTPTNTSEMSNSQNCKNTFIWRCHHHLKVLRLIVNWKFVTILHHLSDNSHFNYYVYIIYLLIYLSIHSEFN